MSTPKFEIESFDFDVYVQRKYVGSIKNVKPDRDVFGYNGRVVTDLKEDVILRGKLWRKGTVVITELIPICGKLITK